MFQVKICGITSWADARSAADAGADAVGFNFFPPSPRFLRVDEARAIARRLPRSVARVGVFVDLPPAEVEAIARAVGLDVVQLHGAESPRAVARLATRRPVIKVFRVRRGFRPAELARYGRAAAFLLDGFDRRLSGGTGTRFDWHVARRAAVFGPVVLAGGLTPANVARAVREAHPAAVDVCSGVERRPGEKDPRRLRALMQAIERVRSEFE